MSIQKEEFGITKAGDKVTKYTLTNHNGMQVAFLDLGAVIQSILVEDRDGKVEDIALGYDTVAGYETNVPSFGAPVGRCANRISGAKFELNGKSYTLDQNDGVNCLHGGFLRFNHCMYQTEYVKGEDFDRLEFSRVSPDGEQGFPGNLTLTISYTWNDANELLIEYDAICDEDTVLNLTNHSYFNIGPGGHAGENVLKHEVQINAKYYNPTGDQYLPTGEFVPVAGTNMDFTEFHPIGDHIGEDDAAAGTLSGYDHNYVLPEHEEGEIIKAATIRDSRNGRMIEVFTDMPGLQFYIAKELVESGGKGGITYMNYGGACFESQQYPNGINQEKFPSPILKAGQEFSSMTVYRFSTEG